MKKKIHALIAISMTLIIAISLAACKKIEGPNSETVPTQEGTIPTEAPTQEPVVTEEPTEVTATDFSECGTEIARLVPGEGENEVHYRFTGYTEDAYCCVPNGFFVADGSIYIHDEDGSLFVYDIESNTGSRQKVEPKRAEWPEFAVVGSLVVFNSEAYDLSSGETRELVANVNSQYISFLYASEGKVYAVSSDNSNKGLSRSMLDLETGKWGERELFVNTVRNSDDGSYSWTFDGSEAPFVPVGVYLGDGADGSHFFYDRSGAILEDGEVAVLKYDASGRLTAYTVLPFDHADLFGDRPNEAALLAEDGCVYVMADREDAVVIYKIAL